MFGVGIFIFSSICLDIALGKTLFVGCDFFFPSFNHLLFVFRQLVYKEEKQ